jgi:hypothetical protein
MSKGPSTLSVQKLWTTSPSLEFSCLGFKGRPGLKVSAGLDPVCPQWGPYEAPEGTYSGHGQKNWGASLLSLQTYPLKMWYNPSHFAEESIIGGT